MSLRPRSKSPIRRGLIGFSAAFAALLVAAACSSSSNTSGGGDGQGGANNVPGPNPGPEPGPSPDPGSILPAEVSCDSIVTPAMVADFAAHHLPEKVSRVTGLGSSVCHSVQNVNGREVRRDVNGFTMLEVVPAVKLLAKTQISETSADIFVEDFELQPTDITAISAAFTAATGIKNVRVRSSAPRYSHASLGGLPPVPVQFEYADTAHPEEGRVLRMRIPVGLKAKWASALNLFQRADGAGFIVLRDDALNGVETFTWDTFAPNKRIVFQGVQPLPKIEDFENRWAELVSLGDVALKHPSLPFEWMEEFYLQWPNLHLTPIEAQREFPEAYALAKSLWSPRTVLPEVTYFNHLMALRLLSKIEPDGDTKKYQRGLALLDQFFGLTGDEYLELVAITNGPELTDDQGAMILKLAREMKSSMSDKQAWHYARDLAARVQYDATKLSAVGPIYSFLQQTGNADYATVASWIGEHGMTTERLELLKSAATFLKSVEYQSDANNDAIDLVVMKGGTADQVETLKNAYAFYSQTLYKSDAFNKAKSFVFDSKLTSADLDRLTTSFNFLKDVLYKNDALARAEKYVIEKRLSKSQTDAIAGSYQWLSGIIYKNDALDKAESYVFDKGVDLARFEQMKSLYGVLTDALYKTEALDKTEKLVLTNHLTRAQTDLLQQAYVWLKDMLYKTDALERAEKYVVTKKMTQEQYDRLVKAFDQYHKTMYKTDALDKAQKDILGL